VCVVSCASIPCTHTTSHSHACTCVDIRTSHPSRWYIGLAHTLTGESTAGSVGEAEERIPHSPLRFPHTGTTPTTNGIASSGRCLWRRPTWQLFVLLARRRTQCGGRSTSYVFRRYSRFHLLFLARFIVAGPRAASSFAGQPPEISRCSDPCNSDRMDLSIALFFSKRQARFAPNRTAHAGREVKCKRQVNRLTIIVSFLIYREI